MDNGAENISDMREKVQQLEAQLARFENQAVQLPQLSDDLQDRREGIAQQDAVDRLGVAIRVAVEREAQLLDALRSLAVMREENERLKAYMDRVAGIEEKAHLQTIDERDAAEETLGQAYYLIKGESPEWSNLFGYQQALEDIDDVQRCLRAETSQLTAELALRTQERDALAKALNTPETEDFFRGVPLEAAHQRVRWPSEQDAGKTHADWFWLVGYLAGKCLSSAAAGNTEKALHHTISTAAALANWHRALKGAGDMRPGIAEPAEAVADTLTKAMKEKGRQ